MWIHTAKHNFKMCKGLKSCECTGCYGHFAGFLRNSTITAMSLKAEIAKTFANTCLSVNTDMTNYLFHNFLNFNFGLMITAVELIVSYCFNSNKVGKVCTNTHPHWQYILIAKWPWTGKICLIEGRKILKQSDERKKQQKQKWGENEDLRKWWLRRVKEKEGCNTNQTA